jgi:phage virion morphogenesis protein
LKSKCARIETDKKSPDGIAWPAWTERYKATRHAGHKLLEGEGDLLGSIESVVGTDEVEIGSNLIYAATHQAGDADRNIPARTYLGLSGDDEADLEQVIDEFFRNVLKKSDD